MCPDILTIMPETNLVVWSFYDQITGFGVYLGDKTNNGINAVTIEEIENVRWESEQDDTSYAIKKEHLEAGLPGYSVPDITLHGYIEDKGLSTIGWILVPKTQESSSCLVC
jgi:hypothetical protein